MELPIPTNLAPPGMKSSVKAPNKKTQEWASGALSIQFHRKTHEVRPSEQEQSPNNAQPLPRADCPGAEPDRMPGKRGDCAETPARILHTNHASHCQDQSPNCNGSSLCTNYQHPFAIHNGSLTSTHKSIWLRARQFPYQHRSVDRSDCLRAVDAGSATTGDQDLQLSP